MTNGRGCAPPSSLPQRPGCSCHTAISPLFPPISSLLLLLRGWGRGGQPGSGSRTDTGFFFFFSSSPGPPSGCPVSPASLVRRRLLFLAAAATTVRPSGQCHPSGTSQEAALPYYGGCSTSYGGCSPVGIGVHMSRHQHTAVGPLRYLWVFSVFALMHMEGMVLVDKLGDNLPLCVGTDVIWRLP